MLRSTTITRCCPNYLGHEGGVIHNTQYNKAIKWQRQQFQRCINP